jgi:hypothetical protein
VLRAPTRTYMHRPRFAPHETLDSDDAGLYAKAQRERG